MATAKSSRSRAAHGELNSEGGVKDGAKFEENLNFFKSDNFDAFVQSKCHSLNEKEIRQLCSYLVVLKRASAEGMCRSAYANHTAFIRWDSGTAVQAFKWCSSFQYYGPGLF